jgi:4-hydroxy-tetrahydrodipicolinate reductase
VTKICVAGALGRMGRRVLELAAASEDIRVTGAFDLPKFGGSEVQYGSECGRAQSTALAKDVAAALGDADVLIDFTAPEAALENLAAAQRARKGVVLGTTGLSQDQKSRVAEFAHEIAVVFAPNMSVGVNLLFKLTEQVAQTLGLDYNVEIIETHHNQKADSPSGTAIRLAESAAGGLGLEYPKDAVFGREGMPGKRPPRQIGVHAIRGGDVVGEHTVAFIGRGERIELAHKAHSRDTFAAGALVAARFVEKSGPGLYDMQDVLGLR